MSGLGVGLYSMAGVYGKKDLVELKATVLRALELGIEHFDVADQYGPAENFLGEILREVFRKRYRLRNSIKISTKVGVTDVGGRNCSYDYIMQACENSLYKLGTEYIDIYQIHFDDPDTPVEETIGALQELQKKGLIREYSIGHLPKNRIIEYAEKSILAEEGVLAEKVVLAGKSVPGEKTKLTTVGKEVLPKNKNSLSWIMLELSPIALKMYLDLASFCHEKGINIMAMGTTGRGLLTGKINPHQSFEPGDIRNIDPLFHRGMLESGLRVLQRLEEVGKDYGKTPVQVGLNWLNQQPGVELILVGPSTVEHLEENFGCLGWRLNDEDLDKLSQFLLAEEEWRQQTQKREVREVIFGDLAEDPAEVVADLIYAICGLAEHNHVQESDFIPLYREIMLWRREPVSQGKMIRIQTKLANLMEASRGSH